ncbi:MAG: hypothetical protein AB8B91_04305 [Rubripirellula sp.]
MRYLCLLVLILTSPYFAATVCADGFHDDFSDPTFESRQALRGEWKFEDQQASCVSDPELYKKFANHGPILRWPIKMTDGTCSFQFQPKGCQRIVITFNDKGHVFRIALADEKITRAFGWIGQSSKENKPKTIAKEGVPTLDSLDGKWNDFKLAIKDDKADLLIGDRVLKLQHASLARTKGEFTISFASGELAVRDVALTSN